MSNYYSNYKDIHKQIATADFTDEQIQELITALQTKRSAKSKLTTCDSIKVIKNGTRNGRQRYFCKDCHKTFGDTNGTVAFRSKI